MTSEVKIENNLFNDKKMEEFIQLYDDELTVNADCDPISYWIKKLDNDELKSEKTNYIRFFKIILENILGYEFTDIQYEESIGDEGRPVEFTLKKGDKDYVVVELKGTTCKDLNKRYNREQSPIEQVTNYASIKEETQWAFVSNYDEFRFFNPSYREKYISFKFKQLTDPNVLKRFLLIFSKFSLIEQDIPQTLLKETKIIERELEDEFYKLFSETRLMIIEELKDYGGYTNLEAIRLAQLILNRFIFLCFAEDLRLIPSETTADVLLTPIRHKNLFEFTMWDRLNELFRFADKGNEERGIGGFNGGLFKESLRHLEIRDKVDDLTFFTDCYKTWKFEEKYEEIENLLGVYKDTLNPIYKNLLLISSFDFGSELSVNILGHIFENSIGDIEELKDETTERRKKDGVFYTPEYITDYLCRNTIIPYLSINGTANTVHELITEYEEINSLDELDEKLKDIKIIDPSCGSGACLNKAVDILFEIHKSLYDSKYSDDNLDKYVFDSLDSRRQIIINNIYGVDLNEESVEITKLSLFLKLATSSGVKKGFKLPNLDKNIKCGNSIIDDEAIVGDKAFVWENEFEDIFSKGGFDIVIGNPPWGAELSSDEQKYIENNYHEFEYQINSYVIFIEKSYHLLRENGLLCYITPHSWLYMFYYKKIRKFLVDNTQIQKLVHIKYFAFADVISESVILCYKKSKDNLSNEILTQTVFNIEEFIKMEYNTICQSFWKKNYENGFILNKNDFIQNILDNNKKFDDICIFSTGIKPYQTNKGTPKQTKDDVKNKIYSAESKISDDYEPYLIGANINKYRISYPTNQYIKFGDCLAEPRNSFDFKQKKIIIKQTSNVISASIDEKNFLNLNNAHDLIIKKDEDYSLELLLAILNSNLMNYIYGYLVPEEGSVFSEVKIVNLRKLPICTITKEQENSVIEYVNVIIEKNKDLQTEINSFHKWLIRTFNIDKLSKKLETYYELEFEEFLKEIKKKKVNVKQRKTQELLENEFNESISLIKPLQKEIQELDYEINQLVYELYGLTAEEIAIIENSFQK